VPLPIFEIFMAWCPTQEEALVKISAYLVSKKNCKVHLQIKGGSKTVF
jgi:hypothetical protein